MDSVFRVEICNKDRDAELWLPATDYQLLDIVDKLQIIEDVRPSISILQYDDRFLNLVEVMEGDPNLFELNALATRLAPFELEDVMALHALVSVRLEAKGGEIPTTELLDLAYSTDCCDVHPGVETYEELGHFYVENGLVPELKDISEKALQFLNYAKIGKELSEGECGVLIPGGYVTQTSELKEVSKSMEFRPPKPDYTILLELEREDARAKLKLPATLKEIEATLHSLGANGWTDPLLSVRCLDCAAPVLNPILGGRDGMVELSLLAVALREMTPQQLTKYKAALEAVEDWSLSGAIRIAQELDSYLFSPQYTSPEDMARDFLESSMGDHAAQQLAPFANLYAYGQALMKDQECVLTDYGMVSREDGHSLKPAPITPKEPTRSGMTMQMQ